MARLLFERQGVRRQSGPLANGVALVVYTDAAGTVLADIAASVGGSAIAGSTVTTADIAGLGPAAIRFWGPPAGTDTLYIRVPSDTSLGVQKIEADPDPRLDALEAGGGGGGIAATIFDAKGDLLAATAADTAARLAAGANDTWLTPDSAASTGLKWEARPEVIAPEPIGGGTNDGTALQTKATAAGTGTLKLRAGRVYRLTSVLALPAGMTLEMNGATIEVGGSGEVETGGVGVTIRNGIFYFANDSGLSGGERAAAIRHAGCLIERCRFLGNGFRFGIFIYHVSGGSCDDSEIRFCSFDTTGWGVFKQGDNGTSCNRLKVHHNRFAHIRRGDAILFNVGEDVGIEIHDNDIEDVDPVGVGSAGYGISVAGGTYGGALADQTRQFSITNNTIRNVVAAGIHTEACNDYRIAGNRCIQDTAPLDGTGNGIECYGGTYGTIEDNEITRFETGIVDENGFLTGAYVASTEATLIQRNRVRFCVAGIYSGMAGNSKYVDITDNNLESCTTGIHQVGAAALRFRRNRFRNCTAPLDIDLNASGKSAINATNTRYLEFGDNRTYATSGAIQTSGNTFANFTNDGLLEYGNTFKVAMPLDPTATDKVTWVAPTLAGGWANLGSGLQTTRYGKDTLGFVHVEGVLVSANAPSSTIFTLPAGARPGLKSSLVCIATGNTYAKVDVNADGTVVFNTGDASGYLSLGCIIFAAEA